MAPAYLLRPLLHAAACHAHCARVVYAACRAPAARRCPPCACCASLSAGRLLRVVAARPLRMLLSAFCVAVVVSAVRVTDAFRLPRCCRGVCMSTHCARCQRRRRFVRAARALPASPKLCPRCHRALCPTVDLVPSARLLTSSPFARLLRRLRFPRRRSLASAALAPSAPPRCPRAVCAAALPSRRLRCR